VLKRFIDTVPAWAFALVLIVVSVHTLYIIQISLIPFTGENSRYIKGGYVINYVKPGSPLDKAGIKIGDTMVSCNSYSLEDWFSVYHGQRAGDTLTLGILRNHQEMVVPVITVSALSLNRGLFWSFFIIISLVSISSLYILNKKPGDKTVLLFFLFIQQSAVIAVGEYILIPDPFYLFTAIPFLISNAFIGPTLVHFQLLFPRPEKILRKYKRLPMLFYLIGFVLGILYISNHICNLYFNSSNIQPSIPFDKIVLWWLTITFAIAMAVAIYRFVTIKDTLNRNQLRIVMIGFFFGLVTPVIITLFFDKIFEIWNKYPHLLQISSRTGNLIMIFFILIAIFRYRIWDIEVFIRRALL
jgi:hypothetical protein